MVSDTSNENPEQNSSSVNPVNETHNTLSMEITPVEQPSILADDFRPQAGSSNVVTNDEPSHHSDWVSRAESTEFGLDTHSVDNLMNEAIEHLHNDEFLPSAMETYLAPDSTYRESAALNPIEDTWPEFDFSLFETDSDSVFNQLIDPDNENDNNTAE